MGVARKKQKQAKLQFTKNSDDALLEAFIVHIGDGLVSQRCLSTFGVRGVLFSHEATIFRERAKNYHERVVIMNSDDTKVQEITAVLRGEKEPRKRGYTLICIAEKSTGTLLIMSAHDERMWRKAEGLMRKRATCITSWLDMQDRYTSKRAAYVDKVTRVKIKSEV